MRLGSAQSFLESNLHHEPPQHETTHIVDGSRSGVASCSCCCRCGRTREWTPVPFKTKRKSRSYSPIRTGVSELSEWLLKTPSVGIPPKLHAPRPSVPGQAPLEMLPTEILGQLVQDPKTYKLANPVPDHIIGQLALDVPPAEYTPRNMDLVSCLLTSRTLHNATLTTLYSHITIPHSAIFSKFLHHISKHPALGVVAKRLDLSHFTSVGLRRTRQLNSEIRNMTSETLLKCLSLTPAMQEVLVQEHLDDDIDEAVLRKLLYGLSNVRALDFCACSSKNFVDAFSAAISSPSPSPLSIKRLSLHECFTLPGSTLEFLLARLPQLTHLDVCHTRVSDKALASFPSTARLTHLNLGRCSQLTGDGVVKFLTTHLGTTNLVHLNLSCDISRYRLLWESDIECLLPTLPTTLRSFNLSGAKLHSSHLQLLLPLTKHLEELSIGYADLSMQDINSLFTPRPQSQSNDDASSTPLEQAWIPHTLHYLDITSIHSVTKSSLYSSSCTLLSPLTSPLEVLELDSTTISALRDCKPTNRKLGWGVKELGRRGWYVREPAQNASPKSGGGGGATRGRRWWKMGAMWWGMKKIPVAMADVGGLYGHYMYKT